MEDVPLLGPGISTIAFMIVLMVAAGAVVAPFALIGRWVTERKLTCLVCGQPARWRGNLEHRTPPSDGHLADREPFRSCVWCGKRGPLRLWVGPSGPICAECMEMPEQCVSCGRGGRLGPGPAGGRCGYCEARAEWLAQLLGHADPPPTSM